MVPTIKAGDRILAQRIDGGDVKRGDVIVFKQKSWGDMLLVKRVVAVGGDTVAVCTNGKLTVNGKQIDEPYLAKGQAAESTQIPTVEVPEAWLFLLGDERSGSLDSTAHLTEAFNGTVARSAVKGRWTPSPGPWTACWRAPRASRRWAGSRRPGRCGWPRPPSWSARCWCWAERRTG